MTREQTIDDCVRFLVTRAIKNSPKPFNKRTVETALRRWWDLKLLQNNQMFFDFVAKEFRKREVANG